MIICAENDDEVSCGCNKPIVRGEEHYECPTHGVVRLAKFLRIDSIRAKYCEGLMALNNPDALQTSGAVLVSASSA